MQFVIQAFGVRKRIDERGIKLEFENYLRDVTITTRKYFEMIQRGFTRHTFVLSQGRGVIMRGGDMEVVYGALKPVGGNKVLSHVNWGTSPRWIYPRNAPQLRFRIGYRRATTPGSLSVSPPWVKYGNELIYAPGEPARHPGIRARRFDQLIQELVEADAHDRGRRMMRAVSRKIWTVH